MKQVHTTTNVAGIDVSKGRLDVAVHGGETVAVANTTAGIAELVVWLKARDVGRVGLEPSGGYDHPVTAALQAAAFEVVVHHANEVRLFARFKRLKAKTDRLDAALIALATTHMGTVKALSDPRLHELAERMTAYEHVAVLAAQMKVQMEHVTLKDLIGDFRRRIASFEALKVKIIKGMTALIQAHPDLAVRLDLLRSLPGFGPVVALSVLVRMPELGEGMAPGQAASLLGAAPFTRESGLHKGASIIAGGRGRPRRMLYIAAMAARRCDPGIKAFADGLAARGKPPKVILVAVMRKLIIAANLVLTRQTAWEKRELKSATQLAAV